MTTYGHLYDAGDDKVLRDAKRHELFESLRSGLQGNDGIFWSVAMERYVYVWGEPDTVRRAALFDIEHGARLAGCDDDS